MGAHESETTIFRHVNLCWSKVHAISPMLQANDLVEWMLSSFCRRRALGNKKKKNPISAPLKDDSEEKGFFVGMQRSRLFSCLS